MLRNDRTIRPVRAVRDCTHLPGIPHLLPGPGRELAASDGTQSSFHPFYHLLLTGTFISFHKYVMFLPNHPSNYIYSPYFKNI